MWKGFSISAPTITAEEVEKEIDELPIEEQQRIHDDLYGKNDPIVETESMIALALQDLNVELDKIPADQKQQYLRAKQMCPEYVNDRKFLLPFLRADLFDAKASAARLVTYWESKVQVFGEQAFSPLTLASFDTENDNEALRLGGGRVLPIPDEGGRVVLVVDRQRFDQRASHRKSMLRLFWYMFHVAIENEQAQKNGIVILAGHPRRRTTLQEQDRKLDSLMLRYIRTSLPVRVAGIHHYSTSKIIEYVVPVLLVLLGSNMRQRYVLHSESEDKFLETLYSYGIRPEILPIDMGGKHDYDYQIWLQKRQENDL